MVKHLLRMVLLLGCLSSAAAGPGRRRGRPAGQSAPVDGTARGAHGRAKGVDQSRGA